MGRNDIPNDVLYVVIKSICSTHINNIFYFQTNDIEDSMFKSINLVINIIQLLFELNGQIEILNM